MDLVGLKIGGSVTTYKDRKGFPLEINEIKKRALEFIAIKTIEKMIIKDVLPIIDKIRIYTIALGVGPFGHYLVDNGIGPDTVHQSCAYYCSIVEGYLRKMGLPVVYEEKYSPRHTVFYENGEPNVEKLSDRIKELLEKEKILVTHGDMTIDNKVVSADQLIPRTAIKLKANRIIAATNVDGLYNKDPKLHTDAEFISKVGSDEKLDVFFEKRGIDVTGMIPKKVERFQVAAKLGIKGYIINGLKEGRLKNALLGKETIGTLILP